MISESLFQNAESYSVYSLHELMTLCEDLRKKDSTRPYCIHVILKQKEKAKLKFPYSYFRLIFEGEEIYGDLYAKMRDENGNELTTWKTATLTITGSHNILEGMKVSNRAMDPVHKGQEVALSVFGDDNLFKDCTLFSTQDTLFVGPLPDELNTRYLDFIPYDEDYQEGNLRNYFISCGITGTVDFIFGAGQAIFYHCDLISIDDTRDEYYVTAPANSLKDDFGYLFSECHFVNGGVKEGSTYLGRPWRDYGKCVFHHCVYDSHISPLGFHDWSDVNRTRTCRFEEYPRLTTRVLVRNKPDSKLPLRYQKALDELIHR